MIKDELIFKIRYNRKLNVIDVEIGRLWVALVVLVSALVFLI